MFARTGSVGSPHAFSDGFAPAIGVAAALSLVGAVAGMGLPGRREALDARQARAVDIDAPPGAVWDAIVDVDRWPAWAVYLKSLRRLDGRPLGLGSQVKVTPKGLPGGVWTVTEYDAPRSYTWTTRVMPGLNLTSGHVLDTQDDQTSATFSLAATGTLAAPLAPLLSAVFRRNTRLATEGLKRHCEQRAVSNGQRAACDEAAPTYPIRVVETEGGS